MPRHIAFFSLADLSKVPYNDAFLPALARKGWNITVTAVNASQSLTRRIRPFDCVVRDIQYAQYAGLRREAHIMASITARVPKGAVIYWQGHAISSRAALTANWRFTSNPTVYATYDYIDPLVYPARSWLEGILARRADLLLNGEYHRGYVFRTMYRPRAPILITPPALHRTWPIAPRQDERRRQLWNVSSDQFVIVAHGGLGELRNADNLLLAMQMLPSSYVLVVTVPRDAGRARQKIAEYGLGGRVRVMERLSFCEMLDASVNGDAAILLYANNDLGNYFQAPGRFTEYLACGLPILTNNYVGLELQVLKHDLGIAVDAGCPEEIASGLTAIAQRVCPQWREAIRQTYETIYSLERSEETVCTYFENLTDNVHGQHEGCPPISCCSAAPNPVGRS